MNTFQHFLLITGVAYSTAAITVEVRLHSYSNPQSRECDGDDCDIIGECDNIFEFCLRSAGSGFCLTNTITTNEISEDTLSFSASQLSDLGINNPLRFSGITTSTELELFVRITDDDIGNDDPVDTFIVPFDRQQRPDSTFGSPITQSGSCGIGTSISISISITSVCSNANFVGPQCTCPERENQNTCTYFGERQCLGNYAPDDCNNCITGFQAPGCDTCAPDYYPASICTVFCQPRDDAQGHFTCNPNTGAKECLTMYTDPATNCINCIGNFREPDCTRCDPNFQGTECNICAPNYYPQGICNIMCQPRNDSLGHFTCNPITGAKECLPMYTDPGTDCVDCIGNFRKPDCTQCNPNFQGTECNICAPNYYPQGNCGTFCLARNDSSGHYTCDPVTGDKICLAGYEDPTTDCREASGSSSGLDVGLTVGLLLLLLFIGVSICIGVIVCYKKKRRSRQTRAVATTPATGATVVTPNQTTSMTNPNLYAQPHAQYPQQPQPSVLYTQPQQPQQPVYIDAQLGFQEPPPSYDAVTAAANPTQQIPLKPLQQNVPYPVQNQAYPGYPPAGPPPNQAYPPPTAPPLHDGIEC